MHSPNPDRSGQDKAALMAKAREVWHSLPPEERKRRKAAKAALRKERETRRERREAIRAAKARRTSRDRSRKTDLPDSFYKLSPVAPSYSTLRDYHPLAYCERCKRMRRDNLMVSEALCVDCYAETAPFGERGLTKD
jgi:hypothetical protein